MRAVLFAAMSLTVLAGSASAGEDYPTKPVTLIVPYAPGGTTDLLARQLASELEGLWGQPVVVENRAGAGSMIGTAYVAQAKPDGYTLLLNAAAHATVPAIYSELPFDPQTDITPLAMLSYSPFLVVAGSGVKTEGLQEWVADADPGSMFIATSGMGSSSHFAGELFAAESGKEIDIVHFSGGGEALAALMGGHADFYVSSAAGSMAAVGSGKLGPMAVLGSRRYEKLPETPATSEAGIDLPDVRMWQGLFGPGNMPEALVQTINADIARVLQSDNFLAMLDENYTMPGDLGLAEFQAMVTDEMVFWKDLAQQRGIKSE